MNGKARRSLPAVAVILLGLAPVIANAQNGGEEGWHSQRGFYQHGGHSELREGWPGPQRQRERHGGSQ